MTKPKKKSLTIYPKDKGIIFDVSNVDKIYIVTFDETLPKDFDKTKIKFNYL